MALPEFCDVCNIRVASHDPLKIVRSGKIYHSPCYNKPKMLHVQHMPKVVTVWHGVGTFDKRNFN